MLKKLLKYDLQSIFKVLIIFYSLAIFFGVLTRVFLNIENSFMMLVIGQICSGATIAMIFNILINNLMRLWVRFKSNFYGDESYLTHTLPVKKETLYLSKFLSSLIALFVSFFVISFTLFVAYYSKENIEFLKNSLLPLTSIYGSTIIKIIIVFLFILFLEFANALQSGYTGIILGYRKNNAKLGFSILIGFITYIGTQLLVLAGVYLLALFNKEIMNLFVTNEIVNMHLLREMVYVAIAIYTIILIVGYFVNLKLFQKGVNVD